MLVRRGKHAIFDPSEYVGLGVTRHYTMKHGYSYTSVQVTRRKIWRSDIGTVTGWFGRKRHIHYTDQMPVWLYVLLFLRLLKFTLPAVAVWFFFWSVAGQLWLGILGAIIIAGLAVAYFEGITNNI